MRKIFFVLALIISSQVCACKLNEEKIRDDVFSNTRALFDLSDETTLALMNPIKTQKLGKNSSVAMLELLFEDRFFDRPKPNVNAPCPDRINRVYRFYGQDEFRKCNGIVKSEVINGTHEVMYRNCGLN